MTCSVSPPSTRNFYAVGSKKKKVIRIHISCREIYKYVSVYIYIYVSVVNLQPKINAITSNFRDGLLALPYTGSSGIVSIFGRPGDKFTKFSDC